MSTGSVPRENSHSHQQHGVSPLGTPYLSPAFIQASAPSHPPSHPPQPMPAKTVVCSPPVKSIGATPRLLFAWNPYATPTPCPGDTLPTGAGAVKPPEEEVADEGRLASSVGGCSTTSSANNAVGDTAAVTVAAPAAAAAAAAAAAPCVSRTSGTYMLPPAAAAVAPGGARPPLTISALLGSTGYTNRGSPQISSATPSQHAQSQQQQHPSMVHLSSHSDPGLAPGSAHSTPSGPVLKRISTTANDGRQYFLDYSPTPTAKSGSVAMTPASVGGMPNLMLPPNTSPMAARTSPSQHQHQHQHCSPPGMDILDLDGNSSANTSPQAVPLMSPPRSTSSTAGAYLGYAAVPTAPAHAAASILTAASTQQTRSMSGAMLHNPQRTSPSLYPVSQPRPTMGPIGTHPHDMAPLEDMDDSDTDLVYTLGTDPSVFIVHLLPPPPPLPELARVFTVPGVVQSLCKRWCAFVQLVLKSDAFAAVTAAPPPEPSLVTISGDSTGSSTREELAAWYEMAVRWWEGLQLEGTASVDIRAKSRAVSAAVEVVASGRSRRPVQNGAGGGRYAPHGGAGGYRGRGGRGGYSYGGANSGPHRGGGGGHPRGGGGAGAGAGAAGGITAGSYRNPVSVASGYRTGRGGGGAGGAGRAYYTNNTMGGESAHVVPDEVDHTMHLNPAYYPPSNFNPYAESWTYNGDTGMDSTAAVVAASLPPRQQMQSTTPPSTPTPSPYTRVARPPSQQPQLQVQQRGYGATNA
ncbi:hypothetical protein NESM_000490200 [Novymonas esmeraldas]|uniref:Uncharacterized protein n=1 Tax=Novymonas esmeraldas TaxID=1808958 RepID=A0AAW0EN49_9TRYP